MNPVVRKWLRVFRAKTYGYRDIHGLAEQLKEVDDFQQLSQHYESKNFICDKLRRGAWCGQT